MHGAKAGAPTGERNGAWRHGGATKEVVAERRELMELIREAREMERGIGLRGRPLSAADCHDGSCRVKTCGVPK